MINRTQRQLSTRQTLDIPEPQKRPELSLLVAMLARALLDSTRPQTKGKEDEIKQAADIWLNSNSAAPWSMLWVCDHLGISIEAVRKALRQGTLDLTPTGIAAAQGRVVKQRQRFTPRAIFVGIRRDHGEKRKRAA